MHRPSLPILPSLATAALLWASLGCDPKKDGGIAPAASSLAPSLMADAGGKTRSFVIDTASHTSIDMPGKSEHIVATTSGAKGTLTVDPHALAATRGEISVDLTTLETKTFADPKKDGEQTTHARTWLEAIVEGKVQETNRYAVLAIRSVEIVGEADLDKLPLVTVDGAKVRRVEAVVRGDLLIHGHAVEAVVPVSIDFAFAAGGAPAEPSALRIRTTKPLVVTLADHAIMPRDPVGKALQWTGELTHRVATVARVDVDLRATAARQ